MARRLHRADTHEELLCLPGMSPDRVRTLEALLRVRNREDLKRALAAGRVAGLEGFSRELKWRLQTALAADSAGTAAPPAPSSAHPASRKRSGPPPRRGSRGAGAGARAEEEGR
jgi:hypothetical protein